MVDVIEHTWKQFLCSDYQCRDNCTRKSYGIGPCQTFNNFPTVFSCGGLPDTPKEGFMISKYQFKECQGEESVTIVSFALCKKKKMVVKEFFVMLE